jgi:hypothetical protein
MANDRARDISAAVGVQDHALRVGAGSRAPLGGYAACVDGFEAHVGRYDGLRAPGIEAFAPLRQSRRTRVCGEYGAHAFDLDIGHAALLGRCRTVFLVFERATLENDSTRALNRREARFARGRPCARGQVP